jgi:hypothetical protein
MSQSGGELLRLRRCRLLVVAMVLGALLPIFQWGWITLAIALAGIALLLLAYRRECLDTSARHPTHDDTHTRGPEA